MVDVQFRNRFFSRFEAQSVPTMVQNETLNRHQIMPKSKLCKHIDLQMNLDACLAPPSQKNLQKHSNGMQNQGFHSARKKDISRPNKDPRIDSSGSKDETKSPPE